MGSLFLIAHIDDARVAIETHWIESIVHVHDVVPVPRCHPSVAGLFALRSRVLTLIDSQFLVTGVSEPVKKGALAVVAEISGHHFGLLVHSVKDVVSIGESQMETNITPSKKWSRLVTGTALVEGELVMILDPSRLIIGDEAIAA